MENFDGSSSGAFLILKIGLYGITTIIKMRVFA